MKGRSGLFVSQPTTSLLHDLRSTVDIKSPDTPLQIASFFRSKKWQGFLPLMWYSNLQNLCGKTNWKVLGTEKEKETYNNLVAKCAQAFKMGKVTAQQSLSNSCLKVIIIRLSSMKWFWLTSNKDHLFL